MKPYRSINCRAPLWCAGLACLLAIAVGSSGAPPDAPATTVKTNAPPLDETDFPKSEFDQRGGRDPFFPQRTLTPAFPVPENPGEAVRLLEYKGHSGPANRRLAIINNQTLEVGEEREVTTSAGKVKVRCLEIREDSVVIDLPNKGGRKELKLRDGVN